MIDRPNRLRRALLVGLTSVFVPAMGRAARGQEVGPGWIPVIAAPFLGFLNDLHTIPVGSPLAPAVPPLVFRDACSNGDAPDGPDPERLDQAQDPWRLTRDVAVRISVAKTEFLPLERIPVKIVLKNISPVEQVLPVRWNPFLDYRVLVFDSEGKLVPSTSYGRREAKAYLGPIGATSLGGGGMRLHPGEDFDEELVANLVYDMTSPGDYTILVEKRVVSYRQNEGRVRRSYAQSEPLKVKVVKWPYCPLIIEANRCRWVDPTNPPRP